MPVGREYVSSIIPYKVRLVHIFAGIGTRFTEVSPAGYEEGRGKENEC